MESSEQACGTDLSKDTATISFSSSTTYPSCEKYVIAASDLSATWAWDFSYFPYFESSTGSVAEAESPSYRIEYS